MRSRLSFVDLPQGRVTIQSSQLRSVAVSAASGCMRSSFFSCRSTSSITGFGIFALIAFSRSCATSSPSSLPSPSSDWIAFSCWRRKYSRWLRSISPFACDEISCCMVRTSSSFVISSWTRRSRSSGSSASRIACAPSTLRSRLEAVRSASRPGSSMLLAITITSGEMGLPRFCDFSSAALTLRINASVSSEPFSASGSLTTSIRACMCGSPSSNDTMRARDSPCTSTRIRPSGSFSMRMIRATVPTEKTSSAPGSSSSCFFCAASRIMRFSASAWSTALIDFSRLT